MNQPSDFKFRRNVTIGALDAESDRQFLNSCFIDNGDMHILLDTSSPKRLIIGRTGSGKSALLQQINSKKNLKVKEILVENHALRLLENTNIRRVCNELDVNLEKFYIILWEHIFLIELIKLRYQSQQQLASVFKNLAERISSSRDPAKARALEYLAKYGDQLWQQTDKTFEEITQSLEQKAQAEFGINSQFFNLTTSGSAGIDETTKIQLTQKIHSIIDDLQLKELGSIFDLLRDEVFNQQQQDYYLTIDHLDEPWVDESPLKLGLIKALLDTIRKFQKIPNVKIIASLRVDLLKQTMEYAAKSSAQREKYDSLYLTLNWDASLLEEVLDKRINHQFKSSYTNQDVSFKEIFPSKINDTDPLKYLLEKTFYRPRDVIQFVNFCISKADGQASITESVVKSAEELFIQDRMKALQDEWRQVYPKLDDYLIILEGLPGKFKLSDIPVKEIENYILLLLDLDKEDAFFKLANKYSANFNKDSYEFMKEVIKIFYEIGIIGVRPHHDRATFWSFRDQYELSCAAITGAYNFDIHKSMYRLLKVKE